MWHLTLKDLDPDPEPEPNDCRHAAGVIGKDD